MDLVFAPSQVESWPIARLRPYARNAKMHGDDQVAKIAASMAKFGWTVPCMVADDGELIAGHGRVLAATMLGLTEVPVIRLSHLDEAERRAYRIADNKLTELGEWDEALLRDEIAGLLERNPIRLNLGDSPEARVLIQAVCRRGGRQTCRKRSLSIFGPGCSQRLPRERHIGKLGLGSV